MPQPFFSRIREGSCRSGLFRMEFHQRSILAKIPATGSESSIQLCEDACDGAGMRIRRKAVTTAAAKSFCLDMSFAPQVFKGKPKTYTIRHSAVGEPNRGSKIRKRADILPAPWKKASPRTSPTRGIRLAGADSGRRQRHAILALVAQAAAQAAPGAGGRAQPAARDLREAAAAGDARGGLGLHDGGAGRAGPPGAAGGATRTDP